MEKHHEDYINRTTIPESFTMLDSEMFLPDVWGPHYWFFLHTIAHTYPLTPTSVTRRKYYDLIQNFPLFIPNPEIGDHFISILDRYPVSPYLDNRDSFIRWVHFIHNRINRVLGKEEITLFEALDDYKSLYRPKQVKLSERFHLQKEYVIAFFTVVCFVFIFMLY
jgi:hypothetical protein